MTELQSLLRDIKQCTLCQEHLPNGVRPVVQASSNARILIAGQAPGRKVHESGVPFDDPSGDRLREWMGVSKEQFYDADKIALLPMGFCYPGTGKSGDLPPRLECEPAWRKALLAQLPNIEITLVLGKYAQDYHFRRVGGTAKNARGSAVKNASGSVTELVKAWPAYWPKKVPLPHPSPRNNLWLNKNPWFETELLPPLQKEIARVLAL